MGSTVLAVMLANRVADPAAGDAVGKLGRQVQDTLPAFQGRLVTSSEEGLLVTFGDPASAIRCAGEIHRLADALARAEERDLLARIAAHTGDVPGDTVTLAERILSVTGSCETCVTAETWAALAPEDRSGFAPHGPEVFKGFSKVCFLYRKAHSNPINDLTFRPESPGDEEVSRQFTDALPKHSRYALVLEHPQVTATVVLSEGETHVFGRSSECGTVIPDRMFSGTHVAFAVVEGILWCFDLQSSNGVLYRGRRIRRRKPIEKNSMVELPTGSIQVKLP